MKVLTVIVNYRTPELTCKSIRAVVRACAAVRGETKIVVVDNDSGDGSFEKIRQTVEREGWAGRVEVRASERNGGFGYGNNFAMRPALASAKPPDYVYLLNPDAFPAEDALAKLVSYMDANPRLGIAGSYIHGVDGRPHYTAFRFPSVLSEFEHAMRLALLRRLLRRYILPLPIPTQACAVDWVAGASMLLRREMLADVGLFDERFFLYYEETDLCQRAIRAHWPTVYLPESKVAHVGGASTGMQDPRRRRPAYWFDSRRRYFINNHGHIYLWLANAAQIFGGIFLRMRFLLQGRLRTHPLPERYLRDFVSHMLRRAA